jgi:O-antigen/teichoic acid export membrane protein
LFLAIGQCVSASSGATNAFMNMTGKQVAFRNIICCAAIINILLNYFLIPLMGISGSALAAMSSTIFWNIASLLYIKIQFGKTIGYLPMQKITHRI